ncbi:hypothetical protein [Spirosoma koreense]
MNTEQNYVGRGSIASPIEQTAKNKAQSPISPDDRQLVDKAVYDAQTALIDAVDAYLDWQSPIQAINELLEFWLTSSPANLSLEANKNRLHLILRLVNFLIELKDCNHSLRAAGQQEVGRE